jgi:hypothetical protein
MCTLTWDPEGTPVPLDAARLQIRTRDAGALVREWSTGSGSITLSGAGPHTVTLGALSAGVTGQLRAGVHDYDLEVVTTAGEVWTVLEGTVTITGSITR